MQQCILWQISCAHCWAWRATADHMSLEVLELPSIVSGWVLIGRQLFKVAFPYHVGLAGELSSACWPRVLLSPAASVSAPAECF